jgi:hypothetical protein
MRGTLLTVCLSNASCFASLPLIAVFTGKSSWTAGDLLTLAGWWFAIFVVGAFVSAALREESA